MSQEQDSGNATGELPGLAGPQDNQAEPDPQVDALLDELYNQFPINDIPQRDIDVLRRKLNNNMIENRRNYRTLNKNIADLFRALNTRLDGMNIRDVAPQSTPKLLKIKIEADMKFMYVAFASAICVVVLAAIMVYLLGAKHIG
ncbi:hypothetical protein F5Y06DRAFT_295811 [Hypoxylon sp. FL0890]|nr:hypothetical protein F5Y06DRAFT_295811 [Hypoxylon sp. FL0890]